MMVLAAIVVMAGEIFSFNRNKGTRMMVMASCIPSAK